MKIRVRFLVGNVCSFLSLVLLLAACGGHKWARDAVNSVDIGLWYLTGTGVRYKLINAGAAVDSTEGTSTDQPSTIYSIFCDPWCLEDATGTRAFIVVALTAAMNSFILSVMVAFDIKIPTWNGEGKEATLVTPVVCSLVETVALIPAVTLWQRMVTVYDEQCRETMHINTFTCIETGSTHTYAIAAIPFAAATYLLWRLSHSYHEAKRAGKIADGFTLAAKTGKKLHNVDEILSGIANKIDIDANGSDGRNALHWACTLHRTSICHVLLKKGASISKKDAHGMTALHYAAACGSVNLLMNMLQQCDAELVDKPNKILDLVNNWREGNPIVASHEDDDDSEDHDSTDSSEEDDSDDSRDD
ncbi:hypothetical protein JG687_00000095 [Phytophthora cactorum]|uniref:Ankyrin repeat-containing domain n=1 Tax=Phytophthora cactorum TaxID=29920 RepID=A0A8T1V229_9STRA|nr:hypothetical protein JG687_00000095 [Phytophthora cactorum]